MKKDLKEKKKYPIRKSTDIVLWAQTESLVFFQWYHSLLLNNSTEWIIQSIFLLLFRVFFRWFFRDFLPIIFSLFLTRSLVPFTTISGTKSDLKIGINVVKVNEGENLRKRINANRFLECSAKNNQNINEVIYEAVRAAVAGPLDSPRIGCCQSLRRLLCCYKKDYEAF